ncbi:glycoside hydrolase family 134 protein [Aspergillus lucknowensis]|uniref:Uncharacterized protein n=1 Tax=Aspergillus lucknowensis TaxID=176173 RepID=A0ABR4LNW9_9EURO
MKAIYFVFTSISILGALASPAKRQDDRGSYTVPGLGERKQAVLNAGGNTLDLAIAMLETETMTTDYVYGDAKTEDAANFGLFKQNWGMLRVCATRAGLAGQSTADWNNGAVLNSDINADVASRWDCQEYYGVDTWFAGHRNGASGIEDPNTGDIQTYKEAVYWIQEQIDNDPAYQSDDTRFWVDVTPI